MKKIGLIHTTPVTIEVLKPLAAELLPGVNVINIMDDSILPQLQESDGDLSKVEKRWLNYVMYACEAGAEVIMSACSSVGELVARARRLVPVPVLRIDEPMAEEAMTRGLNIGIAATLPTTLNPTLHLLEQKAEQAGKTARFFPVVAAQAYQRLLAGDSAGHDAILAETLEQLAGKVDVAVLAQASMARVLPSLPPEKREKFLTSPRSGMLQLARVFSGVHG